MSRTEIMYTEDGLMIGVFKPFSEVTGGEMQPFFEELYSKTAVVERLKARGLNTPYELLHDYLMCFYGGNDNRIDQIGENTQSDYCHCGKRGSCRDENFAGLCSVAQVNGHKLNPCEIETLQFAANDKSVKEIADIRNRSPFTIESQQKAIREKTNSRSTTAAVATAITLGIVRHGSTGDSL